MPGINTSGKPQTTDLYLGRGEVMLGTLNATTGKPEHFRTIGNCKNLTLTVETERLEHQSSRTGVRSVDREIVLSQKIAVGLTFDEVTNFENLADFLAGEAAKGVANIASDPGSAATMTDRLIHADALKGKHYELRNTAEERLYDLSTTPAHLVVKSGSGSVGAASTLVRNVDYEVDYVWGTIFLLSTGAHVDGNNLWFTYTSQANEQSIQQVTMLTKSKLSVFLRFKAINPANDNRKMLVDLHSVSLSADGELALISDEFGEMTMAGVAERNETGFPTAPTGRIYYHADAV
jgi:hypothetical protein